MDGIVLVDKPNDISSFGVVARVRWILSQAVGHKVKVGHTGTLDPAATGLMILVIGSYCKRASEFSKLSKTYEAQLSLGAISTTADAEGQITKINSKQPSKTEVMAALDRFRGKIRQTPPIFSAIKVDGQRAYKLARQGADVQLKPREVEITSIIKIDYNYPLLRFTVSVSSGTYIRSLAEDIGKALDVGAYLSGLRRIEVGEYNLKRALILDNLEVSDIISHVKQISPK